MNAFQIAYWTAALWSSNDNSDESGGEPLDDNYGIEDIGPDTLAKGNADCDAFQRDNAKLLAKAGDDEQNGHDFWLTRNHHGAGFWDRGYANRVGEGLTKAAHVYGEVNLDVCDGVVYSD